MSYHLQVCHREWVVWWYGPRTDGKGHIDPAENIVTLPKVGEIRIPFKLPDVEPWCADHPPQEVCRVTCWGWRFRTNDFIHDCGWYLVDSKEQALDAARAWIPENTRPDSRERFEVALDDVREYSIGLW